MKNREAGGVVLAFVGFVFLIGAVKGTWKTAWHDLTGSNGSASSAASATTGTSNGGSAGNGSSNLPGSGPAPTTTTITNRTGGTTTVTGP